MAMINDLRRSSKVFIRLKKMNSRKNICKLTVRCYSITVNLEYGRLKKREASQNIH